MTAAAQQMSRSYTGVRPGGAPRQRTPWQTIAAAVGTIVMGVTLVAVMLGIPAKLAYDINGPGEVNKNTSWDMLKMSNSIDKNIKYVDEQTDGGKGHYVGILTSINESEDAIPLLATAVGDMMAGIVAIDQGLTSVNATTTKMAADMAAMSETTGHSSATMSALNTDIGGLSNAMAGLYAATQQLTAKMAEIETKAKYIAGHDTNVSRSNAEALNRALPAGVPKPTTDIPIPTTGGGGVIDQ